MTRAENASNVINRLKKLGLQPPQNSRLMLMNQVLQAGHHEFGTPECWIALESDRDMIQLGFIFDELESHSASPAFQGLAKKLLYDHVLSHHDRENSTGRDAQFELYLAAVCHKAGLLPVGYHEPDVTCVVDGVPFGVAAKRIKNVQNARARIKKAATQIIGAGRPGIIALDLSIGFNRDNQPVVSPIHNQMLDVINDAQARSLFDALEHMIERVGRGKGVLGVVAFDFRTRLVDGAWRQHRSAIWLELENSESECQLFQSFYDRFTAVLPNVE